MKSLREQFILRLMLAWILTAGTLFLLFHFCKGPVLDHIVAKHYVEEVWAELSDLELGSILGGNAEDSREADLMEDLEDKAQFVIFSGTGDFCLGRENRFSRERKQLLQETDSFSENPAAAVQRTEHADLISLRGRIVYDGEPYYVYIYKNMRLLRERLRFAEAGALIALLIGTALMVVLILITGRPFGQDLAGIRKQTASFAAGEYSGRIRVAGRDNELSGIAGNMNQIADTLQDCDTELKNLRYLSKTENTERERLEKTYREKVGNITHQLKTPLAIISSQIELSQNETDEKQREYYYTSVMEEIEKMSSLISRILREDRSAEASDIQAVLRRICLSDLLTELIPKYESWLGINNIRFQSGITPDVYILGDPELIEQAVHNYIINAFQHTRPGKMIAISLSRAEAGCVLGIYNDGAGIAQNEMEKIWERGYCSGGKKTQGSGLGLYIVRQIVLSHQGTCGVKNEPSGVLFWMRFPFSVM